MTDAIDVPPPAPILMAPTIPVDSAPAANLDSQKNDINSPSSKPHPLLRLPPELALYVSRTDDTLLRLNKLLTTTAGLESLLSTLNYSCYLLTFLHARSPLRSNIALFLSRLLLRSRTRPVPPSKLPPTNTAATSSNLARLTALLTNTRTTLRLTDLLPLYAWLRTLLSTSSPSDPYLHAIALTQCLSYILYQALENLALLIDLHILPPSLATSRYNLLRTPSPAPSTAKLWLISSRFWLAGVACDFFRLLREAYIEAQRRRRHATSTETESERKEHVPTAAEIEERGRRWWSELFVAGCRLPMCVHYSVEGGLFRSSVEDGAVGALGLAASWEEWKVAWAETQG